MSVNRLLEQLSLLQHHKVAVALVDWTMRLAI